jgi:hypothetical protein
VRARSLKLLHQHLGVGGNLLHVGVDARQPLQLARRLVGQIHRGRHLAVALAEQDRGGLRQRVERLGVGQAAALGLQLLVFLRSQPRRADFIHLVVEHVEPLRHQPRILTQALQLRAHLAQLLHLACEGRTLRQQVGEAVEQMHVGARLKQAQVLSLPVNIHQRAGDCGEHLQAHAAPVDAADVAPVHPHLAAQHDPVGRVRVVKPLLLEQMAHLAGAFGVGRQGEGRLDFGQFGAGAHPFARGAIAQQQTHGVDDDRLARAGLAGENVQPRAKTQLELVDNGKVADAQFGKHRPTF